MSSLGRALCQASQDQDYIKNILEVKKTEQSDTKIRQLRVDIGY